MAESEPQKFSNGLTVDQEDSVYEIVAAISNIIIDVEALPRNRTLSLTITKLEEAKLWLLHRLHVPA